jgi:hypothetical protein
MRDQRNIQDLIPGVFAVETHDHHAYAFVNKAELKADDNIYGGASYGTIKWNTYNKSYLGAVIPSTSRKEIALKVPLSGYYFTFPARLKRYITFQSTN